MLIHLIEYINQFFDVPGIGMIRSTSFRAAAAVITSLLIALIIGKRIINYIKRKQYGEIIRDLGLAGQSEKKNTPTMGGIIIIFATVLPVLLFAKLDNIYIIILLITTIWMGIIGFIDDYIKVIKKDKSGLRGKYKVFGQIVLGIIVGSLLYFSPGITIREQADHQQFSDTRTVGINELFKPASESTKTTIPFFKNNELDYKSFLFWMNETDASKYAWLIFIPIVIFIIAAVSNGANLTDGLDGLAAGTSVIIMAALALFAWVSGNFIFADYLDIMFIPNAGEVVVFSGAFIGALIGFLWYNTYPAQVFMGDTGSLTIGGLIAVIAIIVRKELLLPLLCGIFLVENLSVILQTAYFKFTRIRFGEGKRIFKMSPLHHHFQQLNYHENKIVNRFIIVSFLLAVLAVVTLKIR